MRLTRTIYIPADKLDASFTSHVSDLAVKTLTGSCSLEHGYITHVAHVAILSASVEYCVAEIAVRVSCSVSTVKPRVGDVVRCTVQSHLPQGTMLTAEAGGYRVFVPTDAAQPSRSVEIVAVKYDKQTYNCIGKYI